MPIRVLIVDDSPIVRGILRDTLLDRDEFEIVGEAADGLQATQLVRRLRPDVVTMDILMPMMGGMEAIEAIMATDPVPIVVVADAHGRGHDLALDALGRGAVDVFWKPESGFDDTERRGLAAMLRRASCARVVSGASKKRLSGSRQNASGLLRLASAEVRFIGVVGSTGAPHVLRAALNELPGDFPIPIAIVQHTGSSFVSEMAAWLDSNCALDVALARSGEIVAGGRVVVAPSGTHLVISRGGRVGLTHDPPVDGHCPSGTVLLRSLAETFEAQSAGIVLTGMGSDGARGLKAIEVAGGVPLVEDPGTAVVGGMPREAVSHTMRPIVFVSTDLGSVIQRLASGGGS